MEICEPRSERSSRSEAPTSSRPFQRIEPSTRAPSGSSPMIARDSMDLPEPEDPMMPTCCPSGTSRVMPRRMCASPIHTFKSVMDRLT